MRAARAALEAKPELRRSNSDFRRLAAAGAALGAQEAAGLLAAGMRQRQKKRRRKQPVDRKAELAASLRLLQVSSPAVDSTIDFHIYIWTLSYKTYGRIRYRLSHRLLAEPGGAPVLCGAAESARAEAVGLLRSRVDVPSGGVRRTARGCLGEVQVVC
jgi:hypothetical protein